MSPEGAIANASIADFQRIDHCDRKSRRVQQDRPSDLGPALSTAAKGEGLDPYAVLGQPTPSCGGVPEGPPGRAEVSQSDDIAQ